MARKRFQKLTISLFLTPPNALNNADKKETCKILELFIGIVCVCGVMGKSLCASPRERQCLSKLGSLSLQHPTPPTPAVQMSGGLFKSLTMCFWTQHGGRAPHRLLSSPQEKYKLSLTEWQKAICGFRKRSKYRDSLQMCTAQTAFSSLEKKRFVCAKPAKAPPLLPCYCPTPTSWQGLPPCPRHSVTAFILCDL